MLGSAFNDLDYLLLYCLLRSNIVKEELYKPTYTEENTESAKLRSHNCKLNRYYCNCITVNVTINRI